MKRNTLLLSFIVIASVLFVYFLVNYSNGYRRLKRYELRRETDLSHVGHFLESPFPAVRLAAVKCAYRSSESRGSGALVYKAYMEDTHIDNRLEAAFGLRYFPEYHNKLKELINSCDDASLKAVLIGSYGFDMNNDDIPFMLSQLDSSGAQDRVVFISLGNFLRSSREKEPGTYLKRKLNNLVSKRHDAYFLYALTAAGMSTRTEQKLLGRYDDMDENEKLLYISAVSSTGVMKSLMKHFAKMDLSQQIAFAGRAGKYRYLREKIFSMDPGNNVLIQLIGHETDIKILTKYLDSSRAVREASLVRLLALKKTDILKGFKDDSQFKSLLSHGDPVFLSRLYTREQLLEMTRDSAYAVRENGYNLLWETDQENRDNIALNAVKDEDFSIRLTGYFMLFEDNRELFYETVEVNYPGETADDVREYILFMLKESDNKALFKRLLDMERDQVILKRLGRAESYPLRQVRYTNEDYKIRFSTDKGDIIIQCYGKEAPHNVENFVSLVKAGFYNGIVFHRVAYGHVIQAGDPHGDGRGGSGNTAMAEYSHLTYDEPGVVGIADRGKDTGSSQFFINLTPRYHLNSRYTIIGRVIQGMDVVYRIERGDKINCTAVLRSR